MPNYSTALPFNVTATVTSDCNVSATNVDFGQLGIAALQAGSTTTGVVSVTCTRNTAYSVALNAGNGSGATAAERRLTRSGGSDTLRYMLHSDAARTQLWGDGTAGSGTVADTGTGAVQTRTIYASVPAQPAPPPGPYLDTVVVTVTF